MKKFFLFILLFFLAFLLNRPVFSQDRYATCDLCGYCQGKEAPSNWENCRSCLYPNASPNNPSAGDTLRIDPSTGIAPAPQKGHWYTMIGCINTDLAGGFTQEGAAGSVMQKLLSYIFSAAGGIAFLSLLYGAFLIITSQANPERLKQGKRIVYGAVVGLIFSISVVFIIKIIASGILKIPGFQ